MRLTLITYDRTKQKQFNFGRNTGHLQETGKFKVYIEY